MLLLKQDWKNVNAKRLVRHRKEILTLLYHEEVPWDNNHAERMIGGGVVK
ncbi:MAG: hypothetical protein LBC02_00760 [Planctomycetaceae bacterium]|nr:hypothetical protein [Planctomycetaceae bacterium]